MDEIIRWYKRVETFFGSLKFAVTIIILFCVALAVGTVLESLYGTEFANRTIYKAWPFIGLQVGMFLSILMATLIRLPLRKNLYGFYVIHTGLLILFAGSFITYFSGIDGSLSLYPNEPSRDIIINEDELTIQFIDKGIQLQLKLPNTASATDLGVERHGVKVKTYLPFSRSAIQWRPSNKKNIPSSSYLISGQGFSEAFHLSQHPESHFGHSQNLGPLRLQYLPATLQACFGAPTSSGLIVWNQETGECMAPDKSDLGRGRFFNGKQLVSIEFNQQKLSFLPDHSPIPLDATMKVDSGSPYRILSKKIFESWPHLFLFGKGYAYFDKNSQRWVSSGLEEGASVKLPWMNLHLKITAHHENSYPVIFHEYALPVRPDGGREFESKTAILVDVDGKEKWVDSEVPLQMDSAQGKVEFRISKKTIRLPYELTLDKFQMTSYPGTKSPASYESYVTLFNGNEGAQRHHVYMNNPLKHEKFTFYQSSYFEVSPGLYGSVLSVNYDPGRPWKYLGSLLLVLGSIWHYFIRRQKKVKVSSPGLS